MIEINLKEILMKNIFLQVSRNENLILESIKGRTLFL
jgi:hypothetical protein